MEVTVCGGSLGTLWNKGIVTLLVFFLLFKVVEDKIEAINRQRIFSRYRFEVNLDFP